MIWFIFEFILFIVIVFLTFYLISLLYSFVKGSPFVGTKEKNIEIICKNLLEIKKKYRIKRFIDLGSGDGRMVMAVSDKVRIPSFGFEINPFLYFISLVKAKFFSSDAKFFLDSYEEFKLKDSDIVYLYHLPQLLKKIVTFLKDQRKKDFFILSHEFKIKDKNFKLIEKLDTYPYKTYFYKV